MPNSPLPRETSRISATTRWVIVCVAVALALTIALWPRDNGAPWPRDNGGAGAPSQAGPSTTAQASPDQLRAARERAALDPCPTGEPVQRASPLRGVRLQCLGTGHAVDLGALGDRPVLVNVWAWWCGPCRVELPAVAELARRGTGKITILTVHADPNPAAALDLLTELGLHLPAVVDPQARVATLLGAPRAYPATILLRADGSVAKVHARPFTSADEIASAVRADLGVEL